MNEIPNNWKTGKVSDVCEIAYGKDQKQIAAENGRYDILGTGGVIGKTNKFLYDRPSVLIGRKGTIDKPQFINKPFWTVDTLFYTKIFESYSPHWVYYSLCNIDLKKYNEATGVPSLSRDAIYSVPVVIPPLSEQKKIAEILSSVDRNIEATEKLIAKLSELKKALMQELFTKGIGHTKFKDSPLGKIPEEWEVARLVELSIDGINNGVFKDPKKVGKGSKLINVFDLYQGFGVKIPELELLDVTSKELDKFKVQLNDIFFTRSSLKLEGIAYCNINLSEDDNLVYECHIMRVRPNQAKVFPKYLAYYCLSNTARGYFMSVAKFSTMTTISQADIAPMEIPLPPLKEQKKIASILSANDSKIEKAKTRLNRANFKSFDSHLLITRFFHVKAILTRLIRVLCENLVKILIFVR